MRIIHISDLHLSPVFKRDNIKKLKRVLARICREGFDHLVITGDIADNADEKEFLILRKILKKFDLLSSERTSIVIGNHDIFGGVQTALDVVEFPQKCRKTDFDEKVGLFKEYFSELFENAIFATEKRFFPFVKIINDHAFFGINSIDRYSRVKNPFASNGLISDEHLNLFREIAGLEKVKNLKKILLVHHHFYKKNVESTASENQVWNKIETFTMKLRKKKKIIRHIKESGIELVLHGHSHELRDYIRKGIRFINAGASIDNGSSDVKYYEITSTQHETIVKLNILPAVVFNPLSIQVPGVRSPKLAEQS